MTMMPKPQIAPKWKFMLAKLLGTRIEMSNGECTLIAYQWRGSTYVTEVMVMA